MLALLTGSPDHDVRREQSQDQQVLHKAGLRVGWVIGLLLIGWGWTRKDAKQGEGEGIDWTVGINK